MFSIFSSKKEEEEKPKWDPATMTYPDLGNDFDPEWCFLELMSYFDDGDEQKWEIQVDEPGFKQWWTYKDGGDLMMKARTTMKAPCNELIETMINTEERKKWDIQMSDIITFFTSEDGTFRRLTYNFMSTVPLIASDRDFYVAQMVRRDFPEPGDVSIFQRSLPEHPEYPPQPKKVRAHMNIVGNVYRPKKDEEGKDYTEVFLISSVNVAGYIPTAIVNSQSGKVPQQSMKEHEQGTLEYIRRRDEAKTEEAKTE